MFLNATFYFCMVCYHSYAVFYVTCYFIDFTNSSFFWGQGLGGQSFSVALTKLPGEDLEMMSTPSP